METNPDETILNREEPAPYLGVLVPKDRYLQKEGDLAAFRYLKDHPPICEDSWSSDFKDSLAIGFFSFSIGSIATLLFIKK